MILNWLELGLLETEIRRELYIEENPFFFRARLFIQTSKLTCCDSHLHFRFGELLGLGSNYHERLIHILFAQLVVETTKVLL